MATPPAAGYDFGAFINQLGRSLQNAAYEGLSGRPAPWTEKGQQYDQLRNLRGAALDRQLRTLTKPDPTPQQQAAATLVQGSANQALLDNAANADLARRMQLGNYTAGLKGKLTDIETDAYGRRRKTDDDSFVNRANVLTSADIQKMDAAGKRQLAVLNPVLAHEADSQGRAYGFGESLVNAVLARQRESEERALQQANNWGSPGNIAGLLGSIAALFI